MNKERKEELKDEMKNRISLALKDPILQQGFEIICKENAELKGLNNELLEEGRLLKTQIAGLQGENAELKETLKTYNGCGDWDNDFHTCRVYLQHEELQELQIENAGLKEENKKWKDEWQEQVQEATEEGHARTLQTMQLTKAKRLLKILLEDYVSEPEVFSDGSCEDNKLCNLIKEAEQFLKECK